MDSSARIDVPAPSSLGVDDVLAVLAEGYGGHTYTRDELDDVDRYLTELKRLCDLVGLDWTILAAQSAHETGAWNQSVARFWGPCPKCYNPAGIGITGTVLGEDIPIRNPLPETPEDAARVHAVHMWAYVYGTSVPRALEPYRFMDTRWNDVFRAGYQGSVRVVQDLEGTWGVMRGYAAGIVRRWNELFEGDPMPQTDLAKRLGVQSVNDVGVLLVAGHRSTLDAGNPGEEEITPVLARAYRDAFRGAGFFCEWLQEVDGDSDPDDTVGNLDTVGAKTAAWMERNRRSYPFLLMLDLHVEYGPNRGVFAIYPRSDGLRSSISFPPDADVQGNNAADETIGAAIAWSISGATGLPARVGGVVKLGLMGEHQTGVGGRGFRLAMFAYTANYQKTATRLVIEHGNLASPADAAIINGPDFAKRAAGAAVAAVRDLLGISVVDQYEKNAGVPSSVLSGEDTSEWYAIATSVRIVRPTKRMRYCEAVTGEVGPPLRQDDMVDVVGLSRRRKEPRCVLLSDGSRVDVNDTTFGEKVAL